MSLGTPENTVADVKDALVACFGGLLIFMIVRSRRFLDWYTGAQLQIILFMFLRASIHCFAVSGKSAMGHTFWRPASISLDSLHRTRITGFDLLTHHP